MTGDLIPANVLATHTIANVSETLAESWAYPSSTAPLVSLPPTATT